MKGKNTSTTQASASCDTTARFGPHDRPRYRQTHIMGKTYIINLHTYLSFILSDTS